jgi:putative (di)nucleoside polyphosphate hydrolase
MQDLSEYTYRPAAGIMLVNERGQVWVGQRLDSSLDAWQMPQGGLDPGEDAREGALRELEEETGITRELVEIVAQAPEELLYDLPEDLIGVVWKQKWRGQRQTWFLARFLGRDEDVNLQTADPEFRAWRWVEVDDLPKLIVPFKKKLYEDVIAAFAGHLR